MGHKPNQEEDPVWSILPSYDMYQNTFNGRLDPPQYGDTNSVHESVYSSSFFSGDVPTEATVVTSEEVPLNDQATNSQTSSSNPSLIIADESTNSWRETILDNIHNLRNFSSSENPYTQNVELSIHFTEDVGQIGMTPKHIDPSQVEYKQGDYLNGYIYIKNKCSVPIPFDMFYVLFEGNFMVDSKAYPSKKQTIKIRKYLQMYDFAASWNQSRIVRLITDTNDDHHGSFFSFDHRDGSCLGIVGRTLKPGILYKRFFTFKIPDRLLDIQCNDHCLPSHTLLPPSLGLSKKEKISMGNRHQNSNDFSFLDTSASYGVLARFIGRASSFKVDKEFDLTTKLIDEKGDEFIIFRDCTSFIRVVQESNVLSYNEKRVNAETARILYENLLGRIKEKIAIGHSIKSKLAAGGRIKDINSSDQLELDTSSLENHKARQLYTCFDNVLKKQGLEGKNRGSYKISVPLTKKKFVGPEKCLGVINISSPNTEYLLNYMTPNRFNTASLNNKELWKLEIPIRVQFVPSNPSLSSNCPQITKISPELVVFTMKAGNNPIPVEITHEHLFRNPSRKISSHQLSDDFENIVKKPMKTYALELHNLVKEVGHDLFKVERSLLDDICALAAVETKQNRLNLRESKILQSDGTSKNLEGLSSINLIPEAGGYSKQFSIVVDATKAQKKEPKLRDLPANYSSADEFCLVPSFQNCNFGRLYYLRLVIHFSTGDMIELKLPLTIAKMPQN